MQRTISFLTVFFFLCLSVFSISTYADEADTTKKKVTISKKSKKRPKRKKSAAKKLTIIGIVEKIDEDEEGNVTGLVVRVKRKGKKFRLYHVDLEKGKGKELIDLLGKKVKATGIVKKDAKGKRTIIVKKHRLVKKGKKSKSKKVQKGK